MAARHWRDRLAVNQRPGGYPAATPAAQERRSSGPSPSRHRIMDQDNKSRPIERRVFRDEIREQLIDDILSGRLPPARRIVETRLAQQFGVSQAPVREALRDLGLVRVRGQLTFPRHPGAQDLARGVARDLPDPRGARGCRGARRRGPDRRGDAEPARGTDRHMREAAAARDDHRAQADADGEFHHAIIKAAGNRMLEHVWQTMRLSVTTCVTHSVTHRSLHEIAERHVAVLDGAAVRRSGCAPEAAIRRHIEEPGEWILAAAPAGQAAAAPEPGPAQGDDKRASRVARVRDDDMHPQVSTIALASCAHRRGGRRLLSCGRGILKLLAIKDSDVRISEPGAVPRRRRQEPARRRRVLGHHPAGRAVLRRLHGPRRRRSDAARAGSVRAQQGARGGGAGLDLRGPRILRSRRCCATRARTPASSTAIPGQSCPASISRPARWARASRWRRGSRSPAESRRASTPTASPATASSRKGRSGKR